MSAQRGDAPTTPEIGPIVGIVGGGQLARMLAEAATPLGIHVRVLAAEGEQGARGVVADVVTGAADDPDALTAFAGSVDVVTFDHENVDHDALAAIEARSIPVRPSVATLRFADKAHQRGEFAAAGLPIPPFAVVDPAEGLYEALSVAVDFAHHHGAGDDDTVMAKASRGGYDGRGVWKLTRNELSGFLSEYDGAPLVLEPLLALDLEVAVLVARRPSGETVSWPVVETVQVDGMCDEVLSPASLPESLAEEAAQIAAAVAELTDAVGVLAIELFVVDGRLLINEIAPRVHNSGHLTIEASATSQFEQHLRAVLDWPLGSTDSRTAAAVMHNIVGGEDGDPRNLQADAFAQVPDAHLHLYAKTPRPGRKIGHVTVLGDEVDGLRPAAALAAGILGGSTLVHHVEGSADG